METKYYQGPQLIIRSVHKVFPQVENLLRHWKNQGKNCGDELLSIQAISSISQNKLNTRIASIYSLYPGVNMNKTLKFIVSFQTICNYLDKLCAQIDVNDRTTFVQLYIALRDAVDPNRTLSDYYLYYPYKKDNDYLVKLVQECRKHVEYLPSYHLVIGHIKKLVQLYSDVQSCKHLDSTLREQALTLWANRYLETYPGLSWWELCASASSTLGIFALFVLAHDQRITEEEVEKVFSSYFPWICGFNTLLDSFVKSQEDLLMRNINYTFYYDNLKKCEDRLCTFLDRSLKCCDTIKYGGFHKTIIKDLLAMYLSDSKAFFGMNRLASMSLIKNGGEKTVLYQNIYRSLRLLKVL